MRVSLVNWMRRWWPQFGAGLRRHTAKIAACATIGLATTWADPAQAISVHLEITPAETIHQAYAVYFVWNASSEFLFDRVVDLGELAPGVTRSFDNDYPYIPYDPALDDPNGGGYYRRPGYGIIGLHGEGEGLGLVLSFPNDDPIVNHETFDSIIAPNLSNYFSSLTTEPAMLNYLLSEAFPDARSARSAAIVEDLRQLALTRIGQQATLVSFTDASFAGTAIATVPEPATWVLLVSAAGVVAIAARHRSRN